MSADLTVAALIDEIALVAARLGAARDELCRLDGLIGDGDHGVAMAEGFRAAARAASGLDRDASTLADVFNAAAKAFLNAVGASSGPLYATALMRAGKAAGARKAMLIAETPGLIVALAEGVQARGKAVLGDKTMFDAWGNAAEAAAAGRGLEAALAAAREGAEATRAMSAAKGRAARLGERAVGHVDPGAASAVMILEVLVEDWLKRASN